MKIETVLAYPFYTRLEPNIEWVLYGKKADVEKKVPTRLEEIQSHLIQPNDKAVVVGSGKWKEDGTEHYAVFFGVETEPVREYRRRWSQDPF